MLVSISGPDSYLLIVAGVVFGGGVRVVYDFAFWSDVAVVFYDVVFGGFAGNHNAASCGDIIDDGDILTFVRAAVAVCDDVDGGNSAGGANVISLDEEAVYTTRFVNGNIAVAFIVYQLAVKYGAVDVVLVHQSFAIVDSVCFVRSPVSIDEVIISLDGPSPAPHLHGTVVICGGTTCNTRSGCGRPEDVVLEAYDVVCADGSVAGE